ncbi:MAG: hypothetical protein WC414_01425 [Patescibacteria group bacterium]
MFSTSADILYLVLSVSIFGVAIFLSWFLYRAIVLLRNFNSIVESLAYKLELIVDAIEFVRKRVEHLTDSVNSVSGMISSLVEKFIINKITDSFSDISLDKKDKKKNKK